MSKSHNNKKRKVINKYESTNVGSGCIKQKQLTLNQVNTSSKKYRQALFDENVMNYIIKSMKPLHIVDDPNFIELCRGLDSSIKIMSRRTLSRNIEKDYTSVTRELLKVFQNVEFICTTADI